MQKHINRACYLQRCIQEVTNLMLIAGGERTHTLHQVGLIERWKQVKTRLHRELAAELNLIAMGEQLPLFCTWVDGETAHEWYVRQLRQYRAEQGNDPLNEEADELLTLRHKGFNGL